MMILDLWTKLQVEKIKNPRILSVEVLTICFLTWVRLIPRLDNQHYFNNKNQARPQLYHLNLPNQHRYNNHLRLIQYSNLRVHQNPKPYNPQIKQFQSQ
jgi:hypothetical protein